MKKYRWIYLMILMLIPVFLQAQQSPGDMWIVSPAHVEIGENFEVGIYLNSGNQKVAAYGITVFFKPSSLLTWNTSQNGGIIAGADGFYSASCGGGADGNRCISGFDVSGKGPGTALHLLTLYLTTWSWQTATGNGLIQLTIDSLADEAYTTIGTPRAVYGCVTINSNEISGDATQDGSVNIVDALCVAQYYTSIQKTIALDKITADVNRDAKIDIIDALIIAQYSVGIINQLPL